MTVGTLRLLRRRVPGPGSAPSSPTTEVTPGAAPPRAGTARWALLTWNAVSTLLPALALFLFLRTFLVRVFLVPTGSMNPTLEVGDYIVATPAVFGARLPVLGTRFPAIREPEYGDVVVYRPAYNEPVVDVVKRVVGGPGDTIQMVNREVFLNGDRLVEPYAAPESDADEPLTMEGPLGQGWHREALPSSADPATYHPSRNTWGPLVIPSGHYFVLGDNRDRSVDSRHMGFVPRDEITAKVMFLSYSHNVGEQGGTRWERIGRWIR